MNTLILMGRLTRDPEVRYGANGGSAVARINIAVDRRFKKEGGPTADFFQLSAFGKLAEFAEKYLKKGVKIVATCELQNNNYTDKNGNQVYGFQIPVSSIEFAESKKAQEGGSSVEQAPAQAPSGPAPDDGFMNIPDGIEEELPFV